MREPGYGHGATIALTRRNWGRARIDDLDAAARVSSLERERLRDALPHDSLGLLRMLFSGAHANRLRWLAVAQVLDDDLASATASAQEALSLQRGMQPGFQRDNVHGDVSLLPAAIALYSPATDAPLNIIHAS